MAERSKATGCKPVDIYLRRFESCFSQNIHIRVYNFEYTHFTGLKPT